MPATDDYPDGLAYWHTFSVTGWVITLHYPESCAFFGLSLEDALA